MKDKRLPRTFEAAVRRAGEYMGKILWPPITESVRELEEQFPHLCNAWPMLPEKRSHKRRIAR